MKNIILGTDWWTDCDDAVALRLITRAVGDKKIDLLGIVINACMEYSVASMKAFLAAEHMTDIPLGIDLEATDFGGNPAYQKRLAEYCTPDVSNNSAVDAVRLYRQLLSEAKDKTEIIEIGYLQAFSALLKSAPDDISDKTGLELVREKVSKMWVMAGKWDADGEKENNLCRNERSRKAGKEFCELCPVPVTFLGWEVGFGVISGGELDHDDHLYRILEDHGSKTGRHSWDPMLVLLALTGSEEAAGYTTATGIASVDEDTGANHFKQTPDGRHKFVIKQHTNEFYANEINRRIASKI